MVKRSVPFLFKQSHARVRAANGNRFETYSMFGLPELEKEGLAVYEFEFASPSRFQRYLASALRRWCDFFYGNGGNFQGVLPRLRDLKRAPGIVATSNSVGITLLFLKKLRLLRSPVFVISVGLELHSKRPSACRRKRLKKLFDRAERVMVFANAERRYLAEEFGIPLDKIVARPFGIAPTALPDSVGCGGEEWDLLSVGADWMRDFSLLLKWGREHPEVSIRMVVEASRLETLGDLPENISVETNLSLEEVFDRLARSKAVVIPVKQNPYTAGTTFLIHSLACGRPTLVARTDAIDEDYQLQDGRDCLFYAPGDEVEFDRRLSQLTSLSDEERAEMGTNASRWAREAGNGSGYRDEIARFVREHLPV